MRLFHAVWLLLPAAARADEALGRVYARAALAAKCDKVEAVAFSAVKPGPDGVSLIAYDFKKDRSVERTAKLLTAKEGWVTRTRLEATLTEAQRQRLLDSVNVEEFFKLLNYYWPADPAKKDFYNVVAVHCANGWHHAVVDFDFVGPGELTRLERAIEDLIKTLEFAPSRSQ